MPVSVSAFDTIEHEPIGARIAKFTLVLGLHLALGAWALNTTLNLPSEPVPIRMDVRTIEMSAPKKPQEIPKPVVPQPKPAPQASTRAVVPRAVAATPPAVLTAPSTANQAPAAFAVAPQQVASSREEAPPAPAPVALTAARFDADYLNNPAPVYPPLSRKSQEEGKVLLQVQVSANGEAESVQIKQSSGYPRLDEAAMKAVRKWRFVPARRGTEAVASSVVVPLTFRLES